MSSIFPDILFIVKVVDDGPRHINSIALETWYRYAGRMLGVVG